MIILEITDLGLQKYQITPMIKGTTTRPEGMANVPTLHTYQPLRTITR